MIVDKYGHGWPEHYDLCPVCLQPDNCGDCNHGRLRDNHVLWLRGTILFPREEAVNHDPVVPMNPETKLRITESISVSFNRWEDVDLEVRLVRRKDLEVDLSYVLSHYDVYVGPERLGEVYRHTCERERRIKGARYVAGRWQSTAWSARGPNYLDRTDWDVGSRKAGICRLLGQWIQRRTNVS